nr:unnamed protein product [Spirometra erinaceieuropaei]
MDEKNAYYISSSDALTFASQLLHAFVQTLEVGVALCVPTADPTNLAGLSVRHRLAVSDAETAALILSPLLPIVARWPIYMYRTDLVRSPSSLDGAKRGTNRLHRRTLFFLLKVTCVWGVGVSAVNSREGRSGRHLLAGETTPSVHLLALNSHLWLHVAGLCSAATPQATVSTGGLNQVTADSVDGWSDGTPRRRRRDEALSDTPLVSRLVVERRIGIV